MTTPALPSDFYGAVLPVQPEVFLAQAGIGWNPTHTQIKDTRPEATPLQPNTPVPAFVP